MALAEAGLRVVAADVDLRHPNLHTWVGGHNTLGVSDVLLDEAPLEAALQFIKVGGRGQGLYLLSAGRPVDDVTELLGSRRTARLFESLVQQADVLLLDTPPVLPVADTLVIGRMAAGALLVVESRNTKINEVERAKSVLTRNQTRLLGVVLNKVQERDLAELVVLVRLSQQLRAGPRRKAHAAPRGRRSSSLTKRAAPLTSRSRRCTPHPPRRAGARARRGGGRRTGRRARRAAPIQTPAPRS